jgi:RecB family endonuclease NucS
MIANSGRQWDVGRIERRELREVWKHEAHDFTVWLVDNIDLVGDAIGLELVSAEREQSAGAFNLDLLAEDKDGKQVIIENQLGRSDHDHLGKIITYLTAFDAETAVWIVADPRPEQRQRNHLA